MTQGTTEVDDLVRKRLRALRLAQGLTLEDLAARTHLSPSTLSRIESGGRRLALDQLVDLSRALDTSLDELVAVQDEQVVSNPVKDHGMDALRWQMRRSPDTVILRRRFTAPPPDPSKMRAHTGREWLVVLSGTLILQLGGTRHRITQDQSAEFDTLVPHALGAEGGPADVLMIADLAARRGHREDGQAAKPA